VRPHLNVNLSTFDAHFLLYAGVHQEVGAEDFASETFFFFFFFFFITLRPRVE